MKEKILFTSESVTEGHPDKVCDQIADAILDEIIKNSIEEPRVACEVAATTGIVLVMGEITTDCYVDIQKIVRQVINDIGYDRGKIGFDGDNVGVLLAINEQSKDISKGVDYNEEGTTGAGDQGIMFGYASNETEEYMPIAITLAHKLTKRLAEVRKNEKKKILRPDGKSQVTVEYDAKGKLKRIDSIVVSTHHIVDISQEELRKYVLENVIKVVIPKELLDKETKYYINPTGAFTEGGPKADSGLTGRKIIVDTYGGYAHHGGGSFSGKDPTKVDRTGAYMARYIAKNLVASGVSPKLEVGLSYVIGRSEPTSLLIDTYGYNKYSYDLIIKIIRKVFPLTPRGIIDYFDLFKPIYRQVSNYGHFGRLDLDLAWEKLDKVDEIKKYLENPSLLD
ncbi:MAG TPA: methionine adenosyltransferase [Bacilli bacterium]|nr:methionine adenosyltransferase [Bacilli bacterium]HQO93367.1 methionine adenosyltransferase [Bacilli bacterium]HQQ38836.1 methionine adenosyltransferase [Bacilli bacterium]